MEEKNENWIDDIKEEVGDENTYINEYSNLNDYSYDYGNKYGVPDWLEFAF